MTQQLRGETSCDEPSAQGRTRMLPKVLQSMRHWFSPPATQNAVDVRISHTQRMLRRATWNGGG